MADVSSYMEDEDEENPDEDSEPSHYGIIFHPHFDHGQRTNEGNSSPEPDVPQEECLSPVLNLERTLYNPQVRRERVGGAVLDTLRNVADCPADVGAVVSIINSLASDPDVNVRAEIVLTLPHVAAICHSREQLHHLIPNVILPLILELLTDKDNQIWKTAHTILLLLMEDGLIDPNMIEEQVCPVILMLTEEKNPTEIHAEAVSLMVKVAPLVGKETTERLLLHPFIALCSNSVFQFRKTCASNFSYFCSVVGAEYVENVMLPLFVKLCADSIWSVRKACAEVFMSVTCLCSLQRRKEILAPAFARLLADQSRMVFLVAFQQLGPFISTFADPSVTGVACTGDGEILVLFPEDDECYQSEKEPEWQVSRRMQGRNCKMDEQGVIECGQTTALADHPPHSPPEPPRNSNHRNCLTSPSARPYPSDCTGNSTDKPGPSVNISSSSNPPLQNPVSFVARVYSKIYGESPRKLPLKPPGDPPPEPPVLNNSKKVGSETGDIAHIPPMENLLEPVLRHGYVSNCSRVKDEDGDGDSTQNYPDSGICGDYHIDLESGLASYNTFQYWRMPIPELEFDISLSEQLTPTAVTVKDGFQDERETSKLPVDISFDEKEQDLDPLPKVLGNEVKIPGTSDLAPVASPIDGLTAIREKVLRKLLSDSRNDSQYYADANLVLTKPISVSSPAAPTTPPPPPPPPPPPFPPQPQIPSQICDSQEVSQDLVPQMLIDHFITMTHPELAKEESEIPHHCAFSIPAVALTLGRRHWPLIRRTYEQLASHTQWKVRHTVASSIHKLAKILGEEITTKDLVPIFSGFIKDLDEVRIGILRHFAEFLQLLSPSDREIYLPRLEEFHSSENTSYWRFRHELAHQMLLAVHLFPPTAVCRHMGPLALLLLVDRVACVRKQAVVLMSALIRHLSGDPDLLKPLVLELRVQFAQCSFWSRRQTFAMLCCQLVEDGNVDGTAFSEVWLPPLLSLSSDRVPNVRLVVAQTLSRLFEEVFFLPKESVELVLAALLSLRKDSDRDVRSFVALEHF